MLRFKLPGGPVREWTTGAEPLTIGRAASCRLTIEDPHVSALHAQVVWQAGGWLFQDLHSTNGSALERAGRRMPVGPGPGEKLCPGDRLLLGSESQPAMIEVLTLDEGGAAAPAAVSPGGTVVASRRLSAAAELSGRLESSGRTLAPHLELAERLAASSSPEQACAAWGELLRTCLPGFRGACIAEGPSPQSVFWKAGEEPADAPLALLANARTQEITVHPAGTSGVLAVVPVEPEAPTVAGVACATGSLSEGDLDALMLASLLLGTRLRQLRLISALQAATERLALKNRYLRERSETAGAAMIGQSPAMAELRRQIAAVALSDATVLILGPSGSGKELVARELHRQSLRHAEIFAAINCGALVESLLECELFGCRKGAFTGAVRDREGLFEVAHGGTLFLDEVGDMSAALQVKLLRVLETGEVTAVGATRPRRVQVRVLAATHRDLPAALAAGTFREDLFYRLNVFPIRVPSLAERREDIPLLVQAFLQRLPDGGAVSIDDQALRILCARDYPGNVRQLHNELQRAALLAGETGHILPAHLAQAEDGGPSRATRGVGSGTLKEQLSQVERRLIQEALDRHRGVRTSAAKELGITRQALLQKLHRLGLFTPGED